MSNVQFKDLVGVVLSKVEVNRGCEWSHCIKFIADDGRVFVMEHMQNCCESVDIEDINGDVDDLVGSPILFAEESSSSERPADVTAPEFPSDSQTWTFYRIGTVKGTVVIRWLGESNGYYSEDVDFYVSEAGA